MNETEIRERLLDLAADAPEGFSASPQLLSRARRRIALTLASSVAIALAVVAGGIAGVRWLGDSDRSRLAAQPASPFVDTWWRSDRADRVGGFQTMTIRAAEEGDYEIVVDDDDASVCSAPPRR